MGERVDEKRGRLSKRERERERERDRDREKDEESMRIGEGTKSSGKTDVPKLQAYNECEHPVLRMHIFLYLLSRILVQNNKHEGLAKHFILPTG